MLIEEVTDRRRPGPRAAVARNVDPSGWGTFTVRLRIGRGERWYVGSYRTVDEAVAAARWARAWRDRDQGEVPKPIVMRPSGNKSDGSVGLQQPRYDAFGR